jgi:DNA polymerase III sliding clamp (beta) subunit (PCNA family)
VKPNALVIQSHNPEQEEAEEELEVAYDGPELEIGFNVNYLLDALAATEGLDVQVGLTDGNSSCLIRSSVDSSARFVVMPSLGRDVHIAQATQLLARVPEHFLIDRDQVPSRRGSR